MIPIRKANIPTEKDDNHKEKKGHAFTDPHIYGHADVDIEVYGDGIVKLCMGEYAEFVKMQDLLNLLNR